MHLGLEAELPPLPVEWGEPVDRVIAWLSEPTCAADRVVAQVRGASTAEQAALARLGCLAWHVTETARWPHTSDPDLQRWLADHLSPPGDVIDAFREVVEEGGERALATLYERVMAPENRRQLGTFFTPPEIVARMLDRCAENVVQPARVIDVGAGVGAFTVAAATRWPSSAVEAVDINHATLGLLHTLLASRGLARAGEGNVRTVRADFISWSARREPTAEPALYLGNPPYTRQQLLPLQYRRQLAESVARCGSRAGLSTWILARCLALLGPADAVCLLLPSNWLDAQYAAPVRQDLWRLVGRAVEVTAVRQNAFADARVDAVVLYVGPEQDQDQPLTFARSYSAKREGVDRRVGRCPRRWGHYLSAGRQRSADTEASLPLFWGC